MTINNKKWEKVVKSIFKTKLLDENAWLEKANDLLDSATLFEKEVYKVWDTIRQTGGKGDKIRTGYFGTHFMLIAFAIENILKSKIISKNKIEFRKSIIEKGKLPKVLKSHDLYKLANMLDILLDSKEESYLRRLSRAAVWAGRYPVPLEHKDLLGKKYSDGEIHMEAFFTRGEIKGINKLLDKLLKA